MTPSRCSTTPIVHTWRAGTANEWADQELSDADEFSRRVTWGPERDERDDASIALASLAELYARVDRAKRANISLGSKCSTRDCRRRIHGGTTASIKRSSAASRESSRGLSES